MGMAETGGGSSAAEIEPVGGGVLEHVYICKPRWPLGPLAFAADYAERVETERRNIPSFPPSFPSLMRSVFHLSLFSPCLMPAAALSLSLFAFFVSLWSGKRLRLRQSLQQTKRPTQRC